MLNERNVYYAHWTTKNRTVVLKNLGTDADLRDFDATVCGFSSGSQVVQSGDCDPDKSIELMATDLTHQKEEVGGQQGNPVMTLSLNKLKYLPQLTARVDLLKCASQQAIWQSLN